jgi:hypothetical protein
MFVLTGGKNVSPSQAPKRTLKLTRGFQVEFFLFILTVIAVSLATSAALTYLIASQELAKSFFSAHRDLQQLWKGLLPAALLISAGVGLVAVLLAFLGMWRFKRALETRGVEVLETLEGLGRGDIRSAPRLGEAGHLKPVAEAAGAAVTSLQEHLRQVKGIGEEMQRITMRLNYHVVNEGEITLNEIRTLSTGLNNLSRELNNALKWFNL